MDYKSIILKILIPNKKGIDNKLINKITENKLPNIYKYIMGIYNDSESIYETIKRLYLNIDKKPLCPTCGKPVKFIGKPNKMFSKYCSNSCRAKDPNNIKKWQEGQKNYNIKTYGVDHNFKRKDVIEKRKKTLLNKYGTTNLLGIPKFKEKSINTLIKHYGENALYIINEKREGNVIKKYGFNNVMLVNEIKEKRYKTLKENGTFNTSEPEDISYNILKEKYPDIIRQYKSELYPFNCDFYIPSKDLYIECNYHWTHGCKIYKGTEEDINKVNLWKSKNTDYYNEAIKTWTIRDINKVQVAKENNLNYLIFYNIDELKQWIINQ